MGRLLLACLCLGVFVICGCRAPIDQGAAAGITLAAAVAAAAANRAVTHDCWASCDHGYVCDREVGVCVLPSELKVPTRPVGDPDDTDEGCLEEEDGSRLCPEDAVPTGEPKEARDGGVEAPDRACPPLGDAGAVCATQDAGRDNDTEQPAP